jgi:hypothetical protein
MRGERSAPARPSTTNPASRKSPALASRLPPICGGSIEGSLGGEDARDGSGARCIVPLRVERARFHSAFPGLSRMFSNAFLLTFLRTLTPATFFFSYTSLKHPGMVCTPSNSRPFYNLRTLCIASSAPTPYAWPIALHFSQCHNRLLGQPSVGHSLWARRFLEGGPPGAETFLRSSVSNTLSGRGLGKVLPIRSAKRPVAGKWFMGRPLWPRPAWASSPSSAFRWRTS